MNRIFPNIIGNEIGKLKLEYKINRAVFLGPKAYYLELDNNKNIIKVKGLNSNVANNSDISIEKFHHLLYKDNTLNMQHDKWFKNLSEGTINILNQSYEIKHNANKRELIYDTNDMLISTKPYILKNNAPVTTLYQ